MNQHGGADLDRAEDLVPGRPGQPISDVVRLGIVLAILVVLAMLLIAAGHAIQPECGGG